VRHARSVLAEPRLPDLAEDDAGAVAAAAVDLVLSDMAKRRPELEPPF
jgi:hypothetical protein